MKFRKSLVLMFAGVMLLLCTAAHAIDITPFFKIASDYDKNPIRAKKTWEGRQICIRGEIFIINANDDGDAIIHLAGTSDQIDEKGVVYTCAFSGIPDEVVELNKGQIVKIIGKVLDISKREDMILVILHQSRLAY